MTKRWLKSYPEDIREIMYKFKLDKEITLFQVSRMLLRYVGTRPKESKYFWIKTFGGYEDAFQIVSINYEGELPELDLPKYRTHGDPWNTNFNSLDNYILGSYSRIQLTNMIENTKNKYDYILFVRPDCLYLDKLDLKFLDLVNDNSIVIPNFHLWE